MKFNILVPSRFNAGNLPYLIKSVEAQTYEDWEMTIAVDSDPSTYKLARAHSETDPRIRAVHNEDRRYALRNIVETIEDLQIEGPTGLIDGDDMLCDPDAIQLLVDKYQAGHDVVWTDMECDDPDFESCNAPMAIGSDPYTHPWVSSHFKTFDAAILNYIDKGNFKAPDGSWLKRGYDQALMLPILHMCNMLGLSYTYIDKKCYRYNHHGSSTPAKEHTDGVFEHSIVQLVRARKFVGSSGMK